MQVKSTAKFVLVSPKKLRQVVYLIKNFSAVSAVERLPFVGKKAAEPIKKVLATAIANAKQMGLNTQNLVVKEIQINEGPRLKRFRAGSRGRAKPYRRRMSHIRVVLEGQATKQVTTNVEKVKDNKSETASVATTQEKKPRVSLKGILNKVRGK